MEWLFPDQLCGMQNCASLEWDILVVHIWPLRGAVVTWSRSNVWKGEFTEFCVAFLSPVFNT